MAGIVKYSIIYKTLITSSLVIIKHLLYYDQEDFTYIGRIGVLRVRSSFLFLSCRSPIGTARHLFSRSVSGASASIVFSVSCGISKGSTTSVGIVTTLSLTVLLSCCSRSSPPLPWATLTAKPKRGSWMLLMIRFSSFVGSSSNESLWKETVQRFSDPIDLQIFSG